MTNGDVTRSVRLDRQCVGSFRFFDPAIATGLLVAIVAMVGFVATAWISDDALITLQQVKMFVAGEGIVWNPGVRVQAFTHPTWFLTLSATHAISGAFYWPTLIVSIACSIGAVLILYVYCLRQPIACGRPFIGGAFAIALLLSSAFVDFSTSGMENPLSNLLAALVFWLYDEALARRRRAIALWVVLAAIVLTRLDNAILFLPLAIYLGLQSVRVGAVSTIAPGALLFLAWHGFATFYFGSPLPNTYFAKIVGGAPIEQNLMQGVIYYKDILTHDPFTIAIILFGVWIGLRSDMFARLIALGIVSYLAYVLYVGGDFMRGRFFATPVFISFFLIARGAHRIGFSRAARRAVCVLVLGAFFFPFVMNDEQKAEAIERGVADERAFYFKSYGLLSPHRQWPIPFPAKSQEDAEIRSVQFGCGGVGKLRFESPTSLFFVDVCGLGDPFLARVPPYQGVAHRPGHLVRLIPKNYGRAVIGVERQLRGGHGQALLEDVNLVSKSFLLDPARLGAIIRLATGAHTEAVQVFGTGAPDGSLDWPIAGKAFEY